MTARRSTHAPIRTALALIAALGAVAPALAQAEPTQVASALPKDRSILPEGVVVQGFSEARRAPLPGERARAGIGADAQMDALSALAFQNNGGPAEADGLHGSVHVGTGFNGGGVASTGFAGARLGALGDGPVMDQRDTRMSRLTGDGVAIYENPFAGSSLGYNPRTGYYDRFNGRLSYNQSYLRYLYDGNLAGAPSVSAPADFWAGRR
ncbi:MAG: hypothetical protein RLY86_3737 [Pseudomonadota bacterium]|jgi:hypothetical protein